jgi:hypothetical protein
MSNCTCNNEVMVQKECCLCHVEIETMRNCPQHKQIPICGIPDYFCKTCIQSGWYSTGDTGGPRILINKITGEEKL